MSIENNFHKSKLIIELKEIHNELVDVYRELFKYKYEKNDAFKSFIDNEYRESGVGRSERKAWNDNFCHRASYTLLNKILFVRICEDKGFMLNPEDYIAGEVKDPHIGKKLSKIGVQKWANLITHYTLGELIKLAFNDMRKSYKNIILYKEDKYEILNPSNDELSLKYINNNETTRKIVLKFEAVLSGIVEKLDVDIFDFNNTDGNILGDVYEKFMDRETRKAVGQFYTPEFVIEYILKNTVEKADVVENPFVTVADISCGSGHFLIMAYDILKEKFSNNIERLREKYADEVYEIKSNGKELQQFKGCNYWVKENIHYHILKHCVYGADIDSFAVQLTTINLLLKDLDNFTDEINVIEFDSLIKCEEDYDWKYLKEQFEEEFEIVVTTQINLFGEEEKIEIKHRKENYKLKYRYLNNIVNEEIISREKSEEIITMCQFWEKKFDYVIGNPPYVRQEKILNKQYLEKKYEVYNSISDLLTYFIERSLKATKENGKMGLIVSDKFTRANYGKKIRNFLVENFTLIKYKDEFDNDKITFDDATVDTCIMVIENKKPSKENMFSYNELVKYKQTLLKDNIWAFNGNESSIIKEKLYKMGTKIKDITNIKINRGVLTGYNKAFIININIAKELIQKDSKNKEIIVKILRGRDIDKYQIDFQNQYLINTNFDLNIEEKYPTIYKFMIKYKDELSKRQDQGNSWYNLRACTYYEDFKKEKIIFANMAIENRFYYDSEGYYTNQKAFIITSDSLNLKYLSGLLNSSTLFFYFRLTTPKLMGETHEYSKVFVEETPIILNSELEARIIENVDILLQKEERMSSFDIKKFYSYEIDKTKGRLQKERAKQLIDQIVYKMYGLNTNEIICIEEDTQKYISIEKQNYFKEIENGLPVIRDIFDEKYIFDLAKILTPQVFIEKHIENNRPLMEIAKEYNYEYTTVALLREKYAKEYGGNEPWKFYNLSELYQAIYEHFKNGAAEILEISNKHITLENVRDLLKEKYENFDELIEGMRNKGTSMTSLQVVKEAINTYSDTWSAYNKNIKADKDTKEIVRYDNCTYGLASWSDEIHKKYFMDAIDEYTINNPNKKKANDTIKLFKELEVEDKEDYIESIESKIKRAFR